MKLITQIPEFCIRRSCKRIAQVPGSCTLQEIGVDALAGMGFEFRLVYGLDYVLLYH